jgi:hypothetical protein
MLILLFDTFPATIKECIITYSRSANDPVTPIIQAWTAFPNCIIEEGSNSCLAYLIDIQRKVNCWDDVTSSQFLPNNIPTRYLATYSCIYQNTFNDEGSFQVEYEIYLWDFDTCQ